MICSLSTFFYFDFLALPLFILPSFCKADDECVMNGISGCWLTWFDLTGEVLLIVEP